MKRKIKKAFYKFYSIIKTLRGPRGCNWDKEQTPSTMAPNLLEETFECIDAIRQADDENLKEELGDLFLLITMIGYMKQQEKAFSLADILQGISDKLIRRHPHVFGTSDAKTSKEIIHQWEVIKQTKEKKHKDASVLDSVPSGVSPLEHAFYLQKKAAKFGFDWQKKEHVYSKVLEELKEFETALEQENEEELELEFGDLMFSLINLSRFMSINPMLALNRTNKKFVYRFRHMEKRMKEEGRELKQENLEKMDDFWNEAKNTESHTLKTEK
ncbi:MAG: nucleoside triphosphate pyrophosphohydrolase [Spirochaetales bacterium]|nr:MAG: nucleoside triphosphate pyrophosphohydrolase [Spirochaetales bacterium]